MLRHKQSTGLTLSAAMLCALALAACTRTPEHAWNGEHYGSLKDDTSTSEPARQVFRASARSEDVDTPMRGRATATPAAVAFLLSSASLLLGREAATGISEGHEEVRALIEWALGKFD